MKDENIFNPKQVNMEFKGIASFGRSKMVNINDKWISDFTIIGIPYDAGVAHIPGSRFAPREIRDVSTRYSFFGNEGSNGYWSIESKEYYLKKSIVVDAGDTDVLCLDTQYCYAQIASSIEKILENNSIPVIIGGDHSISFPVLEGFVKKHKTISIIHLDAHLDYRNEFCGVNYSHGSPLRRICELPQISSALAIGCRGKLLLEEDYKDALNRGIKVMTAKDIRRLNSLAIEEIRKLLPQDHPVYVSIDIDFLDPSIAPGTGVCEPGGFDYPFLMEVLEHISLQCKVVGFDLVEVNPMVDLSKMTSRIASEIIIGFMAYLWKQKEFKK